MSIPKLIDLIAEIKKPKLIGGVIVKSKGQILLVRRSETAGKYPNFWAVPMGHVEDNEKFIQGAHREFQEETKLDIDINSLVYLTTLKDSKYNRILKIYTTELEGQQEPSLDHEHVDWGYYDVKSLPHPMEDNLRFALELKV